MKPFPIINSILAVSLAIGTPTAAFAHAGHGDEFQATGGVQRVRVNPETDQMLGIVVTPITQAAKGVTGVMIPATALVDADSKKLVFVQYDKFYEPVEVTTGVTKGELIEVIQGVTVGEKLVTQGSLSLYAESRKTQTGSAAPSPSATAPSKTAPSHAQADAQGIPHSHDANGNMVQSGFPTLAAVGGGAVVLLGTIAFVTTRKKKSGFSNKKGGY